jgi:hypothetical protein
VLWVDKITTKRSISTSPFQIVYGSEAIFPTSLGLPVMRLMQEQESKPNDFLRRINQLIHVQQMREQVFNKSQLHQDKMRRDFDRQTKEDDFKVNELVLKWDAVRTTYCTFLPILFSIIIPFITSIWTHNITAPDHSKVYNVLSHYYMLNLFCIILYITFEPNH